ncbi:MAG: hypothetical protein N5P05_004621 (plasmid) [Chroococcopsis gigantea SAG 12.99]|jgi:WD40 repeat protein|nr:hypothetical protein [Chroococcopsis gigantea SAG 12.99]
MLRYVLEELSYAEIAKIIEYDEGYLKDTASKLWRLLAKNLNQKVSKQNIRAVLKQYSRQKTGGNLTSSKKSSSPPSQDWGEAPDIPLFYGRERELETLKGWLTSDRCRLVAILGMGGIGKTSLAIKLASETQEEFQYLFWRSLRDAPPLDELLTELLKFLAPDNPLPSGEKDKIRRLAEYLRQSRCLIVLDNFDALLAPGEKYGIYRPGYQGYGELLTQMGELRHGSCMLVTSREALREINVLQGKLTPVRVWQLQGLDAAAAGKILARIEGAEDSLDAVNDLIDRYQGNPLALKIAASYIKNLFAENIRDFLRQGSISFNGIADLLHSQIAKLSDLELGVMYWLTVNREPVRMEELRTDIFPVPTVAALLETLQSLRGRSLIERTSEGFTLQPVVMEYMGERLISGIGGEICTLNPIIPVSFLASYGVLKATAKDYVRSSQSRTLIEPLINYTIARLGSKSLLVEKLDILLVGIGEDKSIGYGYAPGNLLNLFNYLDTDYRGYDLSGLPIWGAYLAEATLQRVNFSRADFQRCVFAETFGGVCSVAFSADGQRLATCDTSGESQIWDLTSAKQLNAFKTNLAWTWVVGFAADSAFVVTGGDDESVRLWNVETGECVRVFQGHSNTVNGLAFHPGGSMFATCSLDSTIRLWPLDSSAESRVIAEHAGRVWSVAFSPDSTTLISGSEDLTLKLWDVRTLRCLRTFEGHQSWVKAVAFSPDGKTIASGSFDGVVKLWSISRGECLSSWQGHGGTVTAVAFSPDNSLLATCSYDHTVKIWDLASSACLKSLTEHDNRVWSVAFSPDGEYLASGGDDHAARLWDVRTGRCAKAWKGHSNGVLSLGVRGEEGLLAAGYEDQTVRIWSPGREEIEKVLRGHQNRVWSVQFSPPDSRGKILASGSADRTVKLWDFSSGRLLRTLGGHKGWVWSVRFNGDGSRLVSASYDYTLKLWEVAGGQCLKTFTGHNGPVISALFCDGGRTIVSGSFDSTLKYWDVGTGECIRTISAHENSIWSLGLSADGKYLASGGSDHSVKLWDLGTGECLGTFLGHSGAVMSVAFSPDGGKLIGGSFDGTIRIWDIKSGDCLRTLYGHGGLIPALVSAGDGALISGSFDETIRFWQPETGDCLRILRTPRPYDGMNITGSVGLTGAQRVTLKALGAVED